MLQETNVKAIDKVVVRFAGDSGDGMQLAGNIFSNISAEIGVEIPTSRTIRRKSVRRKVL